MRRRIVPEKSPTLVEVLNQAMILITHHVQNILAINVFNIPNMDSIMSELSCLNYQPLNDPILYLGEVSHKQLLLKKRLTQRYAILKQSNQADIQEI